MKNLKEELLNQFIETIDDVDTWKSGYMPISMAKNHITDRGYRGINFLFSLAYQVKYKWEFPYYLTFKQAKENEIEVKKGSKSMKILYFNISKKLNNKIISDEVYNSLSKEEKQKVEINPFLKYHNVFNVSQTNIEINEKPNYKVDKFNSIYDFIDTLKTKEKPDIIYNASSTACYFVNTNTINMPNVFKNDDVYYFTFFHELIHWTGRHVGRDMTDKMYAYEELVANFGAMLIASRYNMNVDVKNEFAYIRGWLKRTTDTMLIFKAADDAQKAVDFLFDEKYQIDDKE